MKKNNSILVKIKNDIKENMIQADLFPYLMDHDLIKSYLNIKKEIKKINREIAKIEHTRIKTKITTTYLRLPQEDGTFALQNYSLCKIHKELEEVQQELLVHYEKRKASLIEVDKANQALMNYIALNHHSRVSH